MNPIPSTAADCSVSAVDDEKPDQETDTQKVHGSSLESEVPPEEGSKRLFLWETVSCILVVGAVVVGLVLWRLPGRTTTTTQSSIGIIQDRASVMTTAVNMLSKYIPDIPNTSEQETALEWIVDNDAGLIASQDAYGLLERFVFVTWYYSTSGDGWSWEFTEECKQFICQVRCDPWLTDGSVCGWSGIKCDVQGNVVMVLGLGGNVTVEIPSELGTLTNLKHLQLLGGRYCASYLTGSIPSEIGNLSALTNLNLCIMI